MQASMRTFYLYLTVSDDRLILKDQRDDTNDEEDFLTELVVDTRNDAMELVKLMQKVIDFTFAKKALAVLLREREEEQDTSKLNWAVASISDHVKQQANDTCQEHGY